MRTHIRNFRWEDMPMVVAVMNRATPERARPYFIEEVEQHWRAPHNHPEQDCFVAVSDAGDMIGVAIADLLDQPNEANSVLWALPEHPETARLLLQTVDDYFWARALQKSPPDVPIWVNHSASDTDTDLTQLLDSQGYVLARRFYIMRVDFDQPIQPAPIPDGFTVRPLQVDHDALAVYEAQREAFVGHWGYRDSPYDEWLYPTTQPDFHTDLWWVGLDNAAVAGMVLGTTRTPKHGWIDVVGVRPAWRKRGLALAMLTRCLAAYQQHGFTRVELSVDTDNSHQALILYERAGMSIADSRLIYRRYLRGG